MEEITTTDLSKFGMREIGMVKELLGAWLDQGLPDDFNSDQVIPMMNKNSGNVFLTNSDFQVAMMNDNKLESFYSCPYCGHEGFKDEMRHSPKNKECNIYLKEIGLVKGGL